MTFARVLNGVDTSEQPPIVGANYWFDSDTFVENKETREMMYYSRAPNRYSVRVVQHKNAGAWEVFKYRDEELLFRAYGRTFKEAMLYAAWPGSEEDETDELGVWDPWGI